MSEERGLQPLSPDQPAIASKSAQPNAPLVLVWAFKIGDFRPDPTAGWTHAIHIEGLPDLIEELRRAKLQGKVSKLVIVAHGDTGGVVQLTPELTEKNVDKFSAAFVELGDFLTPSGMLVFMSCIAGAGKEGTNLLTVVSSYLPGRIVVGFRISGSIRARGIAGDIWEASQGLTGMNPKLFSSSPRMNEESESAKWVKDKRILRQSHWEEFSSFRGKWLVSRATRNAKRATPYEGATVMTGIETIELAKDNKRIWSATHRIDLTKTPRTIDIKYKTGIDKGRTSVGILEFGKADYDALTICIAKPSTPRPTDFTSPEKSDRLLLELNRSESQ